MKAGGLSLVLEKYLQGFSELGLNQSIVSKKKLSLMLVTCILTAMSKVCCMEQ